MENLYLYFKALHIVGFVSWFAGLFYLVRMFVYHSEANDQSSDFQEEWKAQFIVMQKRVYKIIATPAMVFTWFFGLSMIATNPFWLTQSWFHFKFFLLLLLTAYHFYCKKIIGLQEAGKQTFTSFQFRLLNELPTLFLVAIVLLAVAKNLLNFAYLFSGVLVFGVVLYFSAKAYKRSRGK